jgi:hypothetical protein
MIIQQAEAIPSACCALWTGITIAPDKFIQEYSL